MALKRLKRPMNTANHYMKMADKCERQAAALPAIQIKREFQELARQWRELAKNVYASRGK
jgi:hypothetical protein